MNKIIALSLLGMTLQPFAAVQADESSDWGYVNAVISVGASKLVSKDYSSLQISVETKCEASAEDVRGTIAELVGKVQNLIADKDASLSLKSAAPKFQIGSNNKYVKQYDSDDKHRNNPFFADVCNGNAKVDLTAGTTDLTQKTFSASTSVMIEARIGLSRLATIRQHLEVATEAWNKASGTTSINVGKEHPIVSAELEDQIFAELSADSILADKQTRLDVDKAYSEGGFKELYIKDVSTQFDAYPAYKNFAPQLMEDGNSKITVPYHFAIKYLPKNVAGENAAKSRLSKDNYGTLNVSFTGEAQLHTDYYITTISMSSRCHGSSAQAHTSISEPFAKFKAEAQAVLTSDTSDYERVEETVGTAQPYSPWSVWGRKQIDNPDYNGRNNAFLTVAASWINMCSFKVVTDEPTDKDVAYRNTSSLVLVTNDFKGIQALRHSVLDYTKSERDSGKKATKVEANMGSVRPQLTDDHHYQAVNIMAYENALQQMFAPKGEVAKKLLEEIQASEAYYSVSSGAIRPVFESAPRNARLDARAGGSSYKVIVTSDGGIPKRTMRVGKTYSVTYKPAQDVISRLKAAVKAEQTLHPQLLP